MSASAQAPAHSPSARCGVPVRAGRRTRARDRRRLGYGLAAGLSALLSSLSPQLSAAQQQPAPAPGGEPPAPSTPAAEPEPELPDTDEPQDADRPTRRPCTSQDVLRGLCTEAEAQRASAEKIWRLMARAQLELPIVFDDTPETEMLATYGLGLELDLPFLLRGLYAVGWLGLSQRFWQIEGQSSVDWDDPMIGLGFRHSVGLGNDKSLSFIHRFAAYIPASRPSRYNLYYTTLDWLSAARYPFKVKNLGAFTVGLNLWLQYLFREYDAQFGDAIGADFEAPGGANTRMRFEGGGSLQYAIFDSESAGSLLAELSSGYRQRLRYDGSSEPDWYWGFGLAYTPVPFLSVLLDIEHGYSDLVRGGVPHVIAFDRDETFWHVGLFARY